ncbi:MAG: DUF3604 domain-containing protein [Planctomycetes bacterium]|nr:DUF3604 domain-containing protein [Planctomycetota bacterium]
MPDPRPAANRGHRRLNRAFVLAFLFVVGIAYATKPVAAPSSGAPTQVSGDTYDTQPALAPVPGRPGEAWCAWVAWDKAGGDRILVRRRRADGAWEEPETAVKGPGQFLRPSLACTGNEVHLFWTASNEKGVAGVWRSERGKNGWSEPVLFSAPGVASQNQELAVTGDDRLLVAWQQWGADSASGPRYDIVLRSRGPEGWERSVTVAAQGDNWDPAIATSPDGDVAWLAWSSYVEDDYDLQVVPVTAGRPGQARRLGARGTYDLHPSLAVEPGGAAWLAWDEITIQGHARSGRTTITGANLAALDGADTHKARPIGRVRLVRLTEDKETWIDTEAVAPPSPYVLAHAALPRVVLDDRVHPWLFYRALLQPLSDGEAQAGARRGARKGAGGGKTYWWDCFAQVLGKSWGKPVPLASSDGALEEPAAVPSAEGVLVAWSTEHRREQGPVPRKPVASEDHHGDYENALGRDGDVYAAVVGGARGPGGLAAAEAAATKPPADGPVPQRVERARATEAIEVGDRRYRLFWGDFHKHSNVSRCSSGMEPGPDDHYRYATDVCRYDFLAMSDHSEHTSPYNWWRLQKLADLYHVPGAFVPFYGYEWSARWPIGHHNVIFRGKPDPILRSNVAGARTTPELWKSLAGIPALTIPHTSADPGMGTDFAHHDPQFERVLEIFQAARGSYEYDGCPRQHARATADGGFYWDALDKGLKLGLLCSSDHGWGTAYVAAWAEEDTRESVFDAIWARRCYGSTTYGLIVDARADGRPMGEEFAAEAPPSFEVRVRGQAPIRSVEILGRGEVLFQRGSEKRPIGTKEVRLSWTETEDRAGETWYYVRVIQEDDEMAWTSPVWVTRR